MTTNNIDTLQEKKAQTPKKTFAKLGFSHMDIAELSNAMNALLANYQVHYQKLRNFHWNVKGKDFFDIHEQLEIQYNFAITAIDDIAERFRVFGVTPLSTMKSYLENSEIKEAKVEISSDNMVFELLDDYRVLLEHMIKVVEIARDIGDLGTENMVMGFIKRIEKYHWMLTVFTK